MTKINLLLLLINEADVEDGLIAPQEALDVFVKWLEDMKEELHNLGDTYPEQVIEELVKEAKR